MRLAVRLGNIFDLQDGRCLGAHDTAQLRILDQRHAIGGDDLFQLWQPAALRQIVTETLRQDTDCDEGSGGRSRRGPEKSDQRMIGRRYQFGAELKYSPLPWVRLD